MKKVLNLRILSVLAFYGAMVLPIFFSVICLAHSPHDVIDSLDLSPNYEEDQTIFIIISDHLRKSTDGGYSYKDLVNGLDNKNLLSSIAISPFFKSDKTLFVSSFGDGVYRSRDSGQTWKKVNQGLSSLDISLVAFSKAADYRTLLAAGGESGLYRSQDEGENWVAVIDRVKITSVAFYPESKNNQILAGDSAGNLYLSIDWGASWKIIYPHRNWGTINALAILPGQNVHTIFIGTEKQGVYKAINRDAPFVPSNAGLPDKANIRSLNLTPDHKTSRMIFASTWNEAVFCSTDGGAYWKKYDRGLSKDSQADSTQYRSPHFRDVRISNSFNKDKSIFLAGFDGLFKSLNAGQDWFQLETLPVSQIKGLAISTGLRNYSIAITTYGGGAYLSKDKGNSWLVCNKGLKTTRLSDIVFSANYENDSTIYSASMGILLKSTDAGGSWQQIILDPKNWRETARAILLKLKVPYSLTKKILKRPMRRKKWPTVIALDHHVAINQELYFATRYQGVYRSEDSGLSHIQIWDGMGRTINSMVMSPDFERDGTLYASVRGLGIYKTRNKGRSWHPANNGLSFIDDWQNSNTIHQIHKKDIILAISPDYMRDQTVFAGTSEGLFKTSNGGTRWENLATNQLLTNDYVIGLGVSPNYSMDQTLLVSIRGKGTFKSIDGGNSFRKIAESLLKKNQALEYIQFSPNYRDDRTLFAASDEKLFKSTDDGLSWQLIKRPVRYENNRETFQYLGQWNIIKGEQYSASTICVSDEISAKANIYFVGTGIVLIGPKDQNLGLARIFINDKLVATIDQFSRDKVAISEIFSIQDLSLSPHKLTVEVSGSKNPLSTGNLVSIDAVDVFRQGM